MSSPPPAGTDRGRYAFDNSDTRAAGQLACLEQHLDPVTTGVLQQLPLPPHPRCLDVGAGGGSVSRWLAGQLGPGTRVLATDLDTSRLAAGDGLEVRRHDIRHGPPPGGPWDLIHARLVLLHLPGRRRVLDQLVASLAPGGWLVVGEFSRRPLSVLTAADDDDAAVFIRVIDALMDVLTAHGADLDWAHAVHPGMVEAGLTDVHTVEYAESWRGGSAGAHLHHVNSLQKHDDLRAAGVTGADLAEFRRVLADPAFAARSWHFVCTRGQKPAEAR